MILLILQFANFAIFVNFSNFLIYANFGDFNQRRQTREISQGVRLLILERLTASGPERLRAIKGPKAFNSALPCASYPFHKYSSFFAPP